jgi:hypothetical protein
MDLGTRWVVLFLTLLAFSWQGVVTQTHQHFGEDYHPIAWAEDAGSQAELKARHSPSALLAACPICEEIAHDGAYLLPASTLFPAPGSATAWLVDVPLLAPSLRRRSHAWQSRAPPHQLQA